MAKILKQKDINLLVALEKGGTSSAEAMKRRKILIILLAVVVLIGAAAGVYFIQIMNINNHIEEAKIYIDDPMTVAAYNEAKQKKDASDQMKKQADWIQGLIFTLNSYPDISSKEFSQIYGYAGSRVEITGAEYDGSIGVITFTAKSNSATGVPIFVAQLRMSGIFTDVAYEGYTNNEETTSLGTTISPDGSIVENTETTNKYAFNVSCQLRAGE